MLFYLYLCLCMPLCACMHGHCGDHCCWSHCNRLGNTQPLAHLFALVLSCDGLGRTDPREDRDILPHILGHCKDYISSLQNGAKGFDWSDVSRLDHSSWEGDSAAVALVLQLFNHLHIKIHLFRHNGESDWALYHANKPYHTDPSCYTRRSAVPSFSWSSHVLAPEFCGESLYAEAGKPFCRCMFSECVGMWYDERSSGGWTQGINALGVEGISPHWGTMHNYLIDLLSWSRFAAVCPGDITGSVKSKVPDSVRVPIEGKAAMQCDHNIGIAGAYN